MVRPAASVPASASASASASARGRGRPPDLAKREAVLEATRAILADVGYGSLTINDVARRSNLNRVFVYRIWGTRLGLALDALFGGVPDRPAPDTGSVAGDLRAFLEQEIEVMARPAYLRGLPGLTVELLADPTQYRELRSRYFEPATRRLTTILERAVARGETSETPDAEVVLNVISGSTLHLGLASGLTGDALVETVLALVTTGLVRLDG